MNGLAGGPLLVGGLGSGSLPLPSLKSGPAAGAPSTVPRTAAQPVPAVQHVDCGDHHRRAVPGRQSSHPRSLLHDPLDKRGR